MRSRAILTLLVLAGSCFAQTARDYYNELYAAAGLDRMADEYVCFDDRADLDTFFIFGEGKHIREDMIAKGVFNKLPKAAQSYLNKDFLIFRGYNKGVAVSAEDFFQPDNNSWISDRFSLDKSTAGRVRFTITWATLRYKRAVEVLSPSGIYREEAAGFGRCEPVLPTILQDGN